MRVSDALSIFTHLIALLGFSAICLTGQIGGFTISLFVSSLILSFVNERFRRQYYLNQNAVTILASILLFYVVLSVMFFKAEIFSAILIFLVYTQIIKLLGKKEIRDITQIYVLSFFEFLAGAILSVDFAYGIAFVLYVAVALWAIMIFTIKKESVAASSDDDPHVVTPLFLSTTVILSFAIFMFTAFLFITFPRIKTGVFTNSFIKSDLVGTGFSDEVTLGQVGILKQDNSPVMRVRILNNPYRAIPQPIYWRGIALDEFDGKSWKVSAFGYRIHRENTAGIIELKEVKNRTLSQEIVTEPINTEVLFGASTPVAFRGIEGRKVADINDSYMLPGKVSYRLKYRAYSDLIAPSPDELKAGDANYPNSIKTQYLQLPVLNSRIHDLAEKITSAEDNTYDKALSVKRYLVNNMSYTLTLNKEETEFPLEDFLFKNKSGHCEYFATAMAVLLREVGIPARVVNGFLGGEWNSHGNFYLVRESDAHSWVEVYFPEHGWVLFDPTPPGNALSDKSRLSFIASYIDYLKFRWNRYVVDFSQKDQIRLLSEVENNWRWQKSNFTKDFNLKIDSNKEWLAVLICMALLASIVLTRTDVGSIFRFKDRRPEDMASKIYMKALSHLSRMGLEKADSVTARELAEEIILSGVRGYRSFYEFTEKYLEIRFKGGDMKEVIELEKLLEIFKKETKEKLTPDKTKLN